MTVYERLIEECKKNNISITALCVKATTNKGNLETWKRNKGHMRSDYLLKCANILNCSTDYLLGRDSGNNVTMGDIGNNNNIIGHHGVINTATNNKSQTTMEADLLNIFRNADGKTQVKIMQFMYDLEKENS